jgi:pSer/pThr/pTyr-binding forkhead associated (FHA) protein
MAESRPLRSAIIHHRYVTSIESLARTAYEAHREAHPGIRPAWEETPEPERQAWRAAVSAVAGQTGVTLTEAAPTHSLVIQAGGQEHTFHTNFTVGRHGTLPVIDDFASGQHARFRLAHQLWYLEDLDSRNGTWLNGRRIGGPQPVRKGDKIKIGHAVMTIVAT